MPHGISPIWSKSLVTLIYHSMLLSKNRPKPLDFGFRALSYKARNLKPALSNAHKTYIRLPRPGWPARRSPRAKSGGPEGSRTPDPCLAKATLYH